MDNITKHWDALVQGLPSAQRACLPQMAGITEAAALATRNLPKADLATVRNEAIRIAYGKIHEVEKPAGFKTLLALVASRQAIKRYEYIHAQKRDPDQENSIEANEEYKREDRDYLGDESASSRREGRLQRNNRNTVPQGLAELDEWTRRLVVGVICRGLSHPEMAMELGENEHSIGGFLDAALSKLTKILKQQDHWEKLKEYMYAEAMTLKSWSGC